MRRRILVVPIRLPLLPLGSWFPRGSWPHLPCGACSTGELQISEPTEIDVSARYRDHPGWEPEWIGGHFSVQAECTDRDCRSIALIVGKMKVDADVDERGHWYGDYETFYELRYCDPPLRLLAVPGGTPDDVKRAIESASHVVWWIRRVQRIGFEPQSSTFSPTLVWPSADRPTSGSSASPRQGKTLRTPSKLLSGSATTAATLRRCRSGTCSRVLPCSSGHSTWSTTTPPRNSISWPARSTLLGAAGE